jgi:hypothetical protein
MTKRHLLLGLLAAIAGLILPGVVQTQGPPPGPPGGRGAPPPLRLADVKWQPWNNTGLVRMPTDLGPDGPAPARDLTGLWDPGRAGIGARGARNPAPLTPWGDAVGKTHKSGDGIRQVDVAEINDPLSTLGDPSGYPRNLLFELRSVNFVRTPSAYYVLHMWERRWRAIWTDGRALPTDPDPRWYGYSVGRWEDDSTFVVSSNGTDERSWLDNAGNPHSDQLRVEERWHRISQKRLELTVTLDDPKAYTRSWVAIDKLQFVLIPDTVDLIEMMNAASEVQTVAANYRKEAAQK